MATVADDILVRVIGRSTGAMPCNQPDVFWLLASESDMPRLDDWLSARERAILAGFLAAKRRRDWRLGRWTAKTALRRVPSLGLSEEAYPALEILSAQDGAPEVRSRDRPVSTALSISHRAGWALCAVSARSDLSLGCDVELIEERSPTFREDFFSPSEIEMFSRSRLDPTLLANLIWSAKESALKGLRLGLTVDPREVEVDLAGISPQSSTAASEECRLSRGGCRNGWCPLTVYHEATQTLFGGWWISRPGLVLTVAGAPAPSEPQNLQGVP